MNKEEIEKFEKDYDKVMWEVADVQNELHKIDPKYREVCPDYMYINYGDIVLVENEGDGDYSYTHVPFKYLYDRDNVIAEAKKKAEEKRAEEQRKREALDKQREEEREKREYGEYLRLKAKYEGNEKSIIDGNIE